jgi:hypothetical protein
MIVEIVSHYLQLLLCVTSGWILDVLLSHACIGEIIAIMYIHLFSFYFLF